MKNKKTKKTQPSNKTPSRRHSKKLPSTTNNKVVKKFSINTGIAMSRQLLQKTTVQRSPSIGNARTRSSANNNNKKFIDDQILCPHRKPMPSLKDLEKMYEESDSDDEPKDKKNASVTEPTAAGTSTPIKSTLPCTEINLTSPNTIKLLADKMLDYVNNLTETVPLEYVEPPPPVIPPKKRKNPEVPYIVGCAERPQVPSRPSLQFCKGDDYGIKPSGSADESDMPTPRAKRTKVPNVSKSLFNAKSDEIAARLKELDGTVTHENRNITQNGSPGKCEKSRSFSPIPSTSRDNNTIQKNDELFNESLHEDQTSFENLDMITDKNCAEITNQSCEIIVIDDTESIHSQITNSSGAKIDSKPSLSDKNVNSIANFCDDDSCVEIIENASAARTASPIPVEDFYSSLDLNQTCNIDLPEVIDIDDVIAENNAIINKYQSLNDKIVSVEPSRNVPNTNNDSIVDDKVNTLTNGDTITDSPILVTESTNTNNEVSTISTDDVSTINISDIQSPIIPTINLDDYEFKNMVPQSSYTKNRRTENVLSNHHNRNISLNFQHKLVNGSLMLQYNSKYCKPVIKVAKGVVSSINNNLPVQTSVSPPKTSQPSHTLGDCPICMESLANKSIASTICGHVFCMKCITVSIKTNKKCPTCRKALKGTGYHQLFL